MTGLISTARGRMRVYVQIDGVQDIVFGTFYVLMGASTLSHRPVSVALLAAMFVLLIFYTRLVEAVRQRFTYPRLGYVRFEPVTDEDRRRRIAKFVVFLIVLNVLPFVAFSFFDDHPISIRDHWVRWLPALVGLLLGGVCAVEGVRNAYLRRYLIYGSLYVALGLTLSLADLPFSLVYGWGVLGMGVIMLGGGVYAFWRLIRMTPLDLHAV